MKESGEEGGQEAELEGGVKEKEEGKRDGGKILGKGEGDDREREMRAGGDSRVSSSLLMAKEQRGSY